MTEASPSGAAPPFAHPGGTVRETGWEASVLRVLMAVRWEHYARGGAHEEMVLDAAAAHVGKLVNKAIGGACARKKVL